MTEQKIYRVGGMKINADNNENYIYVNYPDLIIDDVENLADRMSLCVFGIVLTQRTGKRIILPTQALESFIWEIEEQQGTANA